MHRAHQARLRVDFGKAVAEIGLPAFGEGVHLERAIDNGGIGIAKRFSPRRRIGLVEPSDFGNCDGSRVARKQLDFIAGADFALARDGQVKTGARCRKKTLHHFIRPKANAEFVARQSRLRDHHFGGANSEVVAEMDGIF